MDIELMKEREEARRKERLESWKVMRDEYRRRDIQDLLMLVYIVGSIGTILWHYWI